MRHTSLTRNINPVLREHLFKKEVLEQCTSSAKERKSMLMDYFEFLAGKFHLNSPMDITESDIELTNKKTIEDYEIFLREKMSNKEATIYVKLSYIRLFYEDFIASRICLSPMENPFSDSPYKKRKKEIYPFKTKAFYLSYLKKIGGTYKFRDKLMFSLILTMGLTDTDICRLNIEDVIQDEDALWLRMTGRSMPIDPKIFSTSGPVEIIPPLIPVNAPTAEFLKTWLTQRPDAEADQLGNPLFLSKYRKRLKEKPVAFILKNHAEKQDLDPGDFLPQTLRKFAIHTYLENGGDERGLRDFFGCNLFTSPEEGGNMEAFLHNDVIEEME